MKIKWKNNFFYCKEQYCLNNFLKVKPKRHLELENINIFSSFILLLLLFVFHCTVCGPFYYWRTINDDRNVHYDRDHDYDQDG